MKRDKCDFCIQCEIDRELKEKEEFDINLYAQNAYKHKDTEKIKKLIKLYREMLRGKEPLNYELEKKE